MLKFSKEYNGMEYDESQIYPELVLFPVFTKFKSKAKFYIMERNPLERTIQCTSYILCEKQSWYHWLPVLFINLFLQLSD